jgi:hypothetical protein
MSPFERLISLLLGVFGILYLFTNTVTIKHNQKAKNIDKLQIINYILQEVDYELTYVHNDIEIKKIIDQALIKALKDN